MTRTKMITRLVMLPGLAAGLAISASCGGGSGDGGGGGGGGASVAPSGSPDARQMAVLYARCMREHGVPMDDPDFNAEPQQLPPGPATDAALAACRQYQTGGDAPDPAAEREWQRRFADCMRGKGIDVPDPDATGTGGDTDPQQSLDPKVSAAERACVAEVGARPRG